MGVWKLLRLRPKPQLGRSYEPALWKEKTEFPERQRIPLAPRLRDQGAMGSRPVKTETLGRFRSRKYGKPFLRSVSNRLASLLEDVPR